MTQIYAHVCVPTHIHREKQEQKAESRFEEPLVYAEEQTVA